MWPFEAGGWVHLGAVRLNEGGAVRLNERTPRPRVWKQTKTRPGTRSISTGNKIVLVRKKNVPFIENDESSTREIVDVKINVNLKKP